MIAFIDYLVCIAVIIVIVWFSVKPEKKRATRASRKRRGQSNVANNVLTGALALGALAGLNIVLTAPLSLAVSAPVFSAISTSISNNSHARDSISFNASWTEPMEVLGWQYPARIVFSVDGVNYTQGMTGSAFSEDYVAKGSLRFLSHPATIGGNVTLAQLSKGYHEWYSFAETLSGLRNQTPTYGLQLQ